jgi:hypothetical protein
MSRTSFLLRLSGSHPLDSYWVETQNRLRTNHVLSSVWYPVSLLVGLREGRFEHVISISVVEGSLDHQTSLRGSRDPMSPSTISNTKGIGGWETLFVKFWLDIPCWWISSVTEYVQSLVYGHLESDETYCITVCYHFIVIMVKEWWKDRFQKVTKKFFFFVVVVIYWHFKNLLWVKLRDYTISRANPIRMLMFLVRVVVFW